MNTQRSENLGTYLQRFLRALNRSAATEGAETFNVEVTDEGLDPEDAQLLR